MAIDYFKLAFASTSNYMRLYEDYPLPSGGGTITHGLGHVPYFLPFAVYGSLLVPIRTGNVKFPGIDSAFYIIDATSSAITITEDFPPINATTYFVRVYEDPLP